MKKLILLNIFLLISTINAAVENVSPNNSFLFGNENTNTFFIQTEEKGLSLDEFDTPFEDKTKISSHSGERKRSIGALISIKKLPYGELNSDFEILPVIELEYPSFYIKPNTVETISGYEFGYKLYQNQSLKFNAFLEYHMNGYEASNFRGSKSNFSNLDDKESEFFIGISASIVPETSPEFKISADISKSFETSEGLRGRIYGQRYIPYANDLFIVPGVSYTFIDSNYVRYYYGISQSEAERVGIEGYSPTSGHKFGISLDLLYNVSPNVSFRSMNTVEFLSNNIVSSPIVSDSILITVGVGMVFSF